VLCSLYFEEKVLLSLLSYIHSSIRFTTGPQAGQRLAEYQERSPVVRLRLWKRQGLEASIPDGETQGRLVQWIPC